MKTYEEIFFDNRIYKGRRIKINGWGSFLVGSTILHKKLIDEKYNYTSEEAKQVDEELFFFIDSNDFKKSDTHLAKIILNSL